LYTALMAIVGVSFIKILEVEMKKRLLALLVVPLLILSFAVASWSDTTLPRKKQTDLGLYVTAKEVFTKWHAETNKIKILDVRTPGEYVFIGHAPMAANIPIEFFKDGIDLKKMKPVMLLNEKFVDEVKKKFKEADTIMIMCRSGSRSAIAVNKLAKAGFKNVYNITDGFEGDKLNVQGSYNNGKRIVNGWKNSGAPWTYELDPKLVYLP
jgi:rhodanese-related sulfurtransferase